MLRFALLCGLAVAVTSITEEQFVKMRCNTQKEEQTITSWAGKAYSLVPGEQQQELFGLFGINVARCWFDADQKSWMFTSRELQYYLDLETNLPIYKWKNPWTNATNNVVHVANDPVQFPYGNSAVPSDTTAGDNTVIENTVNLFYPNPLYGNASFTAYSWQQMYEGSEIFKFFTPTAEINNLQLDYTPGTHFTWTRISQWLPFMMMAGRPGNMYFTAFGQRAQFEELPAWLQADIKTRLPLYLNAPPCMLDIPDSTSWSYFKEHFNDYIAGAQFPRPASQEPPCQTQK